MRLSLLPRLGLALQPGGSDDACLRDGVACLVVQCDAGLELERSCLAISDAPTRRAILYECFAAKMKERRPRFVDWEGSKSLVCQHTLDNRAAARENP